MSNEDEDFPPNTMLPFSSAEGRDFTVVGFVDGSRYESEVLARGNISIGDTRSRSIPRLFASAARLLGHDVPDGLILNRGEIFFRAGRLEEARLESYYVVKELDPKSSLHLRRWDTPTGPKFASSPEGVLELDASDKGRTYIMVSRGGMSLNWNLSANVAGGDMRLSEIAIFIPAEGAGDESFRLSEYVSHPRTAKLYAAGGARDVRVYPELPFETIKERILRSVRLPETEAREIEVSDPFGLHRFTSERVFRILCGILVEQLDTSPSTIEELARSKGISYEQAKLQVCQYSNLAVEGHALNALGFFVEHGPEAVTRGLFELAHDAVLKTSKELHGGMLNLEGDLAEAMNNSTRYASAMRRKRVGLPFAPGKPPGKTKPAEEKEQERQKFEAELEEVLTRFVKGGRFPKVAVARAMGCGGQSPKTGNDTSLQTFNKKLSRLGINYQ